MFNRNRERSVSVSIKLKSIHQSLEDSKDINLKNHIIGLLKVGRSMVNQNEIGRAESLRDQSNELDANIHNFNNFMEIDKTQTKVRDQVNYFFVIKINCFRNC